MRPSVVRKPKPSAEELEIRLITRYAHLDPRDTPSEVNETLVQETRRGLEGYPEAPWLYSQALEKYEHGAFHRNLLDDLGLALEKLLRALFSNVESLENQIQHIGQRIKDGGGSPELSNMFVKLLDWQLQHQLQVSEAPSCTSRYSMAKKRARRAGPEQSDQQRLLETGATSGCISSAVARRS